MMTLWVVWSMLGGPFKIWVNFKLLYRWHMDFRMFFFWGLHTILLEIDFKQNKTSWKTLITFGEKKSWSANGPPRWTSRSPGRFIGRLGKTDDLLFYTLSHSWPVWASFGVFFVSLRCALSSTWVIVMLHSILRYVGLPCNEWHLTRDHSGYGLSQWEKTLVTSSLIGSART